MIHRTSPRSAILSLTFVFTAAAWWGCTAAPHSTTAGSGQDSSNAGTGGHVGQGGGGGMGGMGDINIDGGSSDGDVPLDDAGACVATGAAAKLIPLDIIIILDKSGSMVENSKWTGITASLKTFITDPVSAGIGVGLVYFPNNHPDDCNYQDYSLLDVPIGTLPMNAQALVNSIPPDPDGGTPTYGALKGALFSATTYQDANPTHKVIVVLATDGEPNECNGASNTVIAALAKSARNYNGVLTFVVGVQGSNIANLDEIALAGGTVKAYDITLDVTLFSKKMGEIRTAALGCEFVIPPPPGVQQLDPDKVNVSYTPKGMGKPKILPHTNNLASCGTKAGWYYDNDIAPTKILLCPASCTTVQADNKAAISVLFGCKTMIN